MISVKKLLEGTQKMFPKALVEYSYVELEKMSDAGRKSRSFGLITNYVGVDQGQHGHARTFWEVDSENTAGKSYDAVIEFHIPIQGGLFGIAKSKWNLKAFHKTLVKADVKVHCSCPDFYWSGMKYNTGPAGKYKGALSPNQNAGYKGEPNVVGNNLKPKIRDPEGNHVLCKHLIAVKKSLGWYVVTLMKDVKNFDNNIKVNDEITKKLDEGKRALGKEIELVEVGDEESQEIIDQIVHEPEAEGLEKTEENIGSEEVIETDSEPIEEPTEKAADVIEDETEEIEDEEDVKEKAEEGAVDIIEDKNEATKAEELEDVEEEEGGAVLEKDKEDEDSEVSDPDEVLGR